MGEEKVGFFRRLVRGLSKTRDSIVSGIDSIFSGFSSIDEDFYEEIEEILAERKKDWRPREKKYKRGVLRLFSEHAASPMKGAYLEY